MTTSSISADSIVDAARAAIRREARAVEGLSNQIDRSFALLAQDILKLSGKVITTGTGTSGIMAERLAHLLAVSGTPAFYLPCLDALHGGMGAITKGDMVVAISKGGQSSELIELVTRLGERGIPVVAVTENPASPFAKAAQLVAAVKTEPVDADPGGLIAMGSTLVAGAWGDALATVLMALRGQTWEEVVHIHPGGVVGQQTELPPDVEL
ncbi:sugar isomerase [Pseudarthrobacter sulfonivorans]|uniref:Sugar isomerase n=1 Tax=Pseudarthrobacter sulfonivorans TaxID=121292 RepID=A0A0U2XIW9_9MICC|nr:SIS domain-containing protein [Pseudarthrobacter sulfonivorans]ALV43698.1 sugar isomerase [Pseudarthrobacter sulfonivorans]